MTSTIDLNAGVMVGRAGKVGDASSGIYVYMYINKPGDYINEHGGPLPQSLAEEAGFDVKKFAKLKAKRAKLDDFTRAMEAELDIEQERELIASGSGYLVYAVGADAAILEDDDGNQLGQVMPRATVVKLFEKLTAEAKTATIEAKPATKPTEGSSHGRTAS